MRRLPWVIGCVQCDHEAPVKEGRRALVGVVGVRTAPPALAGSAGGERAHKPRNVSGF